MSEIPESQLERWTHLGAQSTAKATHESRIVEIFILPPYSAHSSPSSSACWITVSR